MRAPLDAALEEEIAGLDLRISQVWQVLGAVGVAGGVVLGTLVSAPLGLWGGVTAGVFLLWFTVHAGLLRRGSEGPTLLATITDEVMAPTSLRQDIDPGWDDLLLRATQREADRRFDSACEMADALMCLREAQEGGGADDLAELVARAHDLPEPIDDAAAASWGSDLPTRVVGEG